MVKVSKTNEGATTIYKISGAIDENVDFDQIVGQEQAGFVLNLREVARINSIGIKGWHSFFTKLRKTGKKFKFREVSPPLIEQLCCITDLMKSDEIESMCAPFFCQPCKSEFIQVFSTSQLLSADLENLSAPCPTCKGSAKFDEVVDQYFSFLKTN